MATYSRMILPSFARAARWQEVASMYAVGTDFMHPSQQKRGWASLGGKTLVVAQA